MYNFGKTQSASIPKTSITSFNFGKEYKTEKIKKIKPIEIKLPEQLGGGAFIGKSTLKPEELEKVKRSGLAEETKTEVRGGTFEDTEKEVDHIIPIALGGTNAPYNLQALKDTKTISQTIYDAFSGKERLSGEYKPKNRQEGKMVVEWRAIDKYQSGEISLAEARAAVINWNNSPEVFLHEEIEPVKVSIFDVIKEIPNAVKNLFSKSEAKVSETISEGIDLLKEDIPEKIKNGLEVVGNITQSVLQGIAQSGATVAMTFLEPFTGQKELKSEQLDPQLKAVKEFIFGKDPLLTLNEIVIKSLP